MEYKLKLSDISAHNPHNPHDPHDPHNPQSILDIVRATISSNTNAISDPSVIKLLQMICSLDYTRMRRNVLNGYTVSTNIGHMDIYFMKNVIYQNEDETQIDKVVNIKYDQNDENIRKIEVNSKDYVFQFIVNEDHIIIRCEFEC